MSGHWARWPVMGSSTEMVTYPNATDIQDSQHHSMSAASDSLASIPCHTAPHYPAHFRKGSVIQLASGDLKRIEDLTTDDFVRSAEISKDLCIDTSVICGITPLAERGTVMLQFSVGQRQVQIEVESTVEHPFFVYNRGWSSYSPERTLLRYQLHCHQLMINDKCISLTQKSSSSPLGVPVSFMNGSVVHSQPASLARTRLASDSAAVLSHHQQFRHGKS